MGRFPYLFCEMEMENNFTKDENNERKEKLLMLKSKLFKKTMSIVMSAAMMGVTMFAGNTASAATSEPLIKDKIVASDAGYIQTFLASDYMRDGNTGFEIKFEYVDLGTGFSEDNKVGYNDTLQFVVFDQNWGGWQPTVIGPDGYDQTGKVEPKVDTEYTVKVPFSAIEGKLTTGKTVQGINIQTGGVLGAKIKINSLTYTSEDRVSEPVTIEGAWHKTGEDAEADFGSMKVTKGSAYVSANAWNIVISGLDLDDFSKPVIAVTVEYGEIKDGPIYPQAEVMDAAGNPIKENYPPINEAGPATYLTALKPDMQTLTLAYDMCTVKKVQIYNEAQSSAENVYDLTNENIIQNMGAGWNLGNALDSVDENGNTGETIWGNPEMDTNYLFKVVSEAGFKTVRIPVTWTDGVKVNGNSYQITSRFDEILNRVQEVVNMARDYNLFVIINIQHDGSEDVTGQWLDVDASNQTGIRAAFADVWGRIAERFKDYDQHLIFESMNEVMEKGNYNGTPQNTTWANINYLNQFFVDTVREAGGHNDVRFLMVPGYNTNIDQTVTDKFEMPTYDEGTENMMVSVHFYDPYNFTLNTGDGSTTECTSGELAAIKTQFDKLKTKFVDKGIPVVIGEFSAVNKGNIPEIKEYISTVVKDAQDDGLAYIYWDNGSTGENGMGLWNRHTFAESALGKALIPVLTAPQTVAP